MAAENTFHFPKPGQRIVRSVIAVACCFCVFYLRNREGIPFYSALAVLQCIQPYQDSMAQVAKKRVTGTFVGELYEINKNKTKPSEKSSGKITGSFNN